MSNKKGVSDIVVTILLVLLALAAVAMVWAFISGYIGNAKSKISQSEACMDLNLVPVSCQITGNGPTGQPLLNATVTYRLGNSAVNLSDVKILVERKDGSVTPQSPSGKAHIPAPLETKVFVTNVNVTAANSAIKFSVAGVVTIDGRQLFCSETDKIDCK